MNKRRVIILFGGRSAEHEVSILSARNVLLALDRERWEPLLIGIDKQGRWRPEPPETVLSAKGDPRHLKLAGQGPEVTVPVRPELTEEDGGGPGDRQRDSARGPATAALEATAGEAQVLSILRRDDVVFPILHGTYGEDGTVQGLLELADVAYVGSGPLGSGIGMDKDVTKRLLAFANIPVVPWRLVRSQDFFREPAAAAALVAPLGYPLFVKPANAGSSVGVTRVKDPAALGGALATAFSFDEKALVEGAVDAREIECAVLGNAEPVASTPGEVLVHHPDGYYSYDAKYVDSDGADIQIPADVPPEVSERIRTLAVETFKALELAGMARVDFFLDRKSGALYVNEVNTIPGFTAISMYPKMWEASGLSTRELVSRLLDLACERRTRRRALRTSY